ncbi:MAG: LysM peptidoglycan-binding domain-containing protein, partial [Pseudomonadota bacterium]
VIMFRHRQMFIGLAVVLFAAALLSACGGSRAVVARDPKRFIREHELERLPKFDIPVEMNDRVVAWMEYFQGPGRKHFRRYLERSGRYIPLMQEILKREGMPKDLVYIALIESGFNTQARSWAGAVGPWQFMPYTGKDYGLKIDGWVDERRDPYKATAAAAEYFKDLHGQFGDWYLAITSYNAGPGRVQRAIEATGTRNFWELSENRKVLLPEQRDYVPKYIAAAIIAKMPERFGFDRIDYKNPFDFDKGSVETQTDISVIAKCAGVSEDDIVDLNPHLVRGATPPEAHNYEIRLPRGTSRAFHEKYAALSKEERIQVVRYQVQRRDTLASIARRYGISARQLASANGLSQTRGRLERGTTLTIPVSGASARYPAARYAAEGDGGSSGRSVRQVRHTVKRGETAAKIARNYGVTLRQLMAWNNLKNLKRVHAGMKLVVHSGPGSVASDDGGEGAVAKKEHMVKHGDTISTIARRYGVTAKQLIAMNDLRPDARLKAGTRLVIRKGKAAPRASEEGGEGNSGGGGVVVKSEYKVKHGDTLATIARRYGITTKQLMALNDIRRERDLRPGMKLVIRQARAASPAGSPVKLADSQKGAPGRAALEHKVKRGETLSQIASRYDVSTKELMAMNNIRDARGVKTGMSLVIKPATRKASPAAERQKVALKAAKDEETVEVREAPVKKMTVASNAPIRNEGEHVQMDLASPGGLSDQLPPASPDVQPAKEEKADTPAAAPKAQVKSDNAGGQVVYKVKDGDTLWDIARKHKVTIAQIQKWNNLSDPSAVKPGTSITIRKE